MLLKSLYHSTLRYFNFTKPISSMSDQSSTKLLIVGGSYGGLSTLKTFVNEFTSLNPTNKVDIYLIDKRSGLLNILGMPRAIFDVDFARKMYFNLENFNLKFDSVDSTDEEFKSKALNPTSFQSLSPNLKLHFIHGEALNLQDSNTITYKLTNDSKINQLSFDYAVYSTGRRRQWPIDPIASTEKEFIKEVEQYRPKVLNAENISVIGAGALGIEVAGELKERFPSKSITLIHPHNHIPPETFASPNFINKVKHEVLQSGINLKLNTRIEKELENKDLLTTTGETIKSDLNIWCTSHPNNVEPLLPFLKNSIESTKKEVIVDTNFLVKDSKNIFAIGDIVHLPIVKLAGITIRSGSKVADSLINLIVRKEETYNRIDLDNSQKGMTIVVGVDRCVSQRDNTSNNGQGLVMLNHPHKVQEYQDYLATKVSKKLNIKL